MLCKGRNCEQNQIRIAIHVITTAYLYFCPTAERRISPRDELGVLGYCPKSFTDRLSSVFLRSRIIAFFLIGYYRLVFIRYKHDEQRNEHHQRTPWRRRRLFSDLRPQPAANIDERNSGSDPGYRRILTSDYRTILWSMIFLSYEKLRRDSGEPGTHALLRSPAAGSHHSHEWPDVAECGQRQPRYVAVTVTVTGTVSQI
ncbi:hypothetical protein BDW75DRAFT_83033 [Aspergillus navahoensis]